jgi:hypothetical protein
MLPSYHPAPLFRRCVAPVAMTLLLAACDETPTPLGAHDVGLRAHGIATETSARTSHLQFRNRFEIGIDARGSLKPGHPIHLTVTGRANYATNDAEIRLTLPELAAAKHSGWQVVELPLNHRPAAELVLRQGFISGETFRGQAMVAFPEAGYYYVVATAQQLSDDHDFDQGAIVGTGAARGIWLWIDEHGGHVTEEFDPSLFPDGTRPQRGPLGSEKKPPRMRVMCTISPGTNPIIMNACTPTPPPIGPGTSNPPTVPSPSVTVTYSDLGAGGTLRPLVDARVLVKIINPTNNAVVGQSTLTTDASGNTGAIDCKTPNNRIEATAYTINTKVELKSYITNYPDRTQAGQYVGLCGGTMQLTADNAMSQVFTNLNKTWDGHTRVFVLSPPARIRAGVYGPSASPHHTYYDYQNAEVHIEPGWSFDQLWGPFGVFVTAHEYGHLWQDKYLFQPPDANGLIRYSPNCPVDHPAGGKTNFGCAVGEAFADWYAVLVRENDVGRWKNDLETNWYYLLGPCGANCGDDGSIIQGAIHAFLWDLTDGGSTELHDRVQATPRAVSDLFRTCTVKPANGSSFIGYTGVDHLIYCLENRSPYRVKVNGVDLTFFATRTTSSRPTEARSVGPAVVPEDVRRLWMVNLYSKRPGVGSNPTFNSVEEPTEPEEPPTDPGCGTQLVC